MIQLACAVVATAHQRQHLTGVRIESDKSDLRILIRLAELLLSRVEFIHLLIHIHHAGINGLRRGPLQVWIERRINVQSLAIEVRLTEFLDELVANQVDKIRRLACVHAARQPDAEAQPWPAPPDPC